MGPSLSLQGSKKKHTFEQRCLLSTLNFQHKRKTDQMAPSFENYCSKNFLSSTSFKKFISLVTSNKTFFTIIREVGFYHNIHNPKWSKLGWLNLLTLKQIKRIIVIAIKRGARSQSEFHAQLHKQITTLQKFNIPISIDISIKIHQLRLGH